MAIISRVLQLLAVIGLSVSVQSVWACTSNAAIQTNLSTPSTSPSSVSKSGHFTVYSTGQSLCGSGINTSSSSKSFSNKSNGTYSYYSFTHAQMNALPYICYQQNLPTSYCYAYKSNNKTITVVRTPGQPGSINYTQSFLSCSSNSLNISWSAASGANRYEIQERRRAKNAHGGFDAWEAWTTLATNLTTHSYTRSGIEEGYDYQYRVRATYYLNGYSSDPSAWSTASESRYKPWCAPDASSTPDSITAGPSISYDGEASLIWDNTKPAYGTGYYYQIRNVNDNVIHYQGTSNILNLQDLDNGVNTFEVTACNVDACNTTGPLASDTVEVIMAPEPPANPGNAPLPMQQQLEMLGAVYNGSLTGGFEVSASGAATYTVPIAIPPGTAGIAPKLALNYNSQGGNSIAGFGWSLSGLSAIHRCPQTLVQDGNAHTVDYSSDDRFCLDGQRLVVVNNSGEYGANGTEYRTEIDSFSKIISIGSGSSGPDSFTVETKTGETLIYGTTADSAVEAQGTNTIAVWALAQVSDSVSNYYTVTYDENTATGEHLVSQIDYTGNTNEGVSPYQTVSFIYEDRPDVRSGYRAGSLSTSSKRLTNIVTVIGQYSLNYKTHASLQPSRLEQIEYCDVTGTTCREPIEFAWAGDTSAGGWSQSNAFELPYKLVDNEGMPTGTHLTDLNADGFIDVAKNEGAVFNLGTNRNQLGSATGFSATDDMSLPVGSYDLDGLIFIDLDGDGDNDLIRGKNSVRHAWLNDHGAWVASTGYEPPDPFYLLNVDTGMRFMDLNGDGLIDLIRSDGNKNKRKAWLNTGSGWANAPSYYEPNFGAYFVKEAADTGIRLLDLNGDGFQDIVNGAISCSMVYGPHPDMSADDYETCGTLENTRLGSKTGWIEAPNLTPPGYFTKKNFQNPSMNTSDSGARFVDLNADGLPDFVQGPNAWLNTGTAWISAPEYGLTVNIVDGSGQDNGWRFFDLNGDGRSELISQNSVLYHNGSSWATFSEYAPPSGMGTFTLPHPQNASVQIDAGLRLLDINSDGFVDIVLGAHTSQSTWLNTRTPIQITSITTDSNKIIDIEYRSQLDPSVYTADDSGQEAANIRELHGPLQRVYEVSTPNGLINNSVMGQRSTRYHYKGLLVHTQGLGGLGFSEITKTDMATGHYSVSRYNPSYPYVGLPISTKSYTSGNVLLSEMTALTFENIQTKTTTACVRTGFVDTHDTACTASDIAVPVLPYISQQENIVYHLNDTVTASLGSTKTVTDTTYDTDGNPSNVTVTVTSAGTSDANEYKTVTTNNYNDGIDTPQCHLGLLKEARVTTSVGGQTDANSTRTTAFEYDPTTCLLTKDIIEPNAGADIRLETIYQHDNFGNVTHTTVTNGVTSRTTTTSYNPIDYAPTGKGVGTLSFSEDGRFPIKITNALGHSEYHAFDPNLGVETFMTGPNGLSTCWQYDSLGRKTLERQLCGESAETQTRFAYHDASPSATGLTQAATVIVSQSSAGSEVLPESRVYLDHVGRELRTVSYSFTDMGSGSGHAWQGQLVFTDSIYDNLGRTTHLSAPYYGYDGLAPTYWSESTYDSLNRVQTVTTPLGALDNSGTHSTGTTTTNYLGFATEVTDAKGRTKRVEQNANGQNLRVIQAQGSADETMLEYTYTVRGNIKTTQIFGRPDTLVTLGYDVLGRKTRMIDPDMGHWSYTYNAFGELMQQTDAKGQTTTMAYDRLGRLETRTDKNADNNVAQVSRWEYYGLGAPPGSIGKLKQESADNQTSTLYTYNSYGRQLTTAQTTLGKTFVSSQTYDNLGRVSTVTYPPVGTATAYTVERHYNSLGMLWYITGPNPDSLALDVVYWVADSIDERGQLEEARNRNATEDLRTYDHASGWLKYTSTFTKNLIELIQITQYSFDEVGNVMSRQSRIAKDGMASDDFTAIESFQYDALDRITTANVDRPFDSPIYNDTKTYAQDALGNLTTKSDVGTYRYGNACSSHAAGPHAVCEIVDSGGSTLRSYQYDANGNMTWGGATGFERNITYSTFNKPSIITQGANETRFTYGASRSRVYRFSTDGTDDKTTYYLGLGKTNAPLYEVETNTTTNEETHLHFIYAGGYHGGHPFMMQVVKRNTINNEATYSGQEYMHRDHLWSVIAISDHTGRAISTTDPSKQYAYNKNYDAWGKRRNPDWTEGGDNQYTSDRGHLCYTGQESITNVGLIHMNGRVYDPELGRFISADPHIQFSADSQSYNRYSYVLNNPLKYTDPSGYFIRSFFQHIPAPLATVITVVLSIFGGSAGPAFAAIFAGFHGIANGADGNTVVLGAVLTVVGGQLGRGVATSANLVTTAGKLTLSGAMVAGAVAGAFSGGVNAAVAGTNIRRGVLQGLAIGAVSAAVVYGVRQSVGRRVTQKEPVDLDPRFMMAGGTDDDIRAGLAAKALLADQANQAGGSCSAATNSCPVSADQKYANSVEGLAGKPYVLGANGPDSYDCSSAVCAGMRGENVFFGDYTANDLFNKFTTSVNKGSLQRGNLIFYDYTSNGRIDHVTTVLDANRMLHPSSGSGELLITTRTYLDNYTSSRGGTTYYRAIDWSKVSP